MTATIQSLFDEYTWSVPRPSRCPPFAIGRRARERPLVRVPSAASAPVGLESGGVYYEPRLRDNEQRALNRRPLRGGPAAKPEIGPLTIT